MFWDIRFSPAYLSSVYELKLSMIRISKKMSPKYYPQMIKNSFFRSVRNEDVRLMLWDTAGQEEFDAITKAYYRGNVKSSFFHAVTFETHKNRTKSTLLSSVL